MIFKTQRYMVYALVGGMAMASFGDYNPLSNTKPLRPDGWDSMKLEQQARWLVDQMTMEEKVEQLNIQPLEGVRGRGSRSQRWNERLGIGPFMATNGPRGPRPSGTRPPNRVFSEENRLEGNNGPVSPTALCIASTWDKDVMFAAGKQWAQLTKEYGLNAIWGPGLNIIKDNRAGRNAEYAGEDPFVTGYLGVNITEGLQSEGVIANGKHYVGNNWEAGRQTHNVTIPMRPLRELYLPAFRMCVEEADIWSMMTGYNRLNGAWMSSHKTLLLDIARNEWGFDGFFVSDWGARFDPVEAIKNGLNAELPGNRRMTQIAIESGLESGELTMADMDARLMESTMLKLKNIKYFGDETPSGYNFPDFQNMMMRAGTEGAVLLKNENKTLPLKASQKVALIGPFADSREFTISNQGSSSVFDSYGVTLAEAMKERGIDLTVAGDFNGAYWKDKPQFSKKFACEVEFFNGLELEGPVIHTVRADKLEVSSIIPGAEAYSTEGVNGKAFLTNGKIRTKVGSLESGAEGWTMVCWLKWDEQFLNPNGALLHLWKDNNNYVDVTPSALAVRQDDYADQDTETWDDMNRKWTPVALVSDGTSLKLYRHGEEISSVELKKSMEDFNLYVGGARVGGATARSLAVEVDDLRIWEKPLSAEQIAQISTRIFEGAPAAASIVTFEDPNKFVTVKDGIPGLKNMFEASLRATGQLDIPQAGKYMFKVETPCAASVRIDGAEILRQWDEQAGGGTTKFFYYTFDQVGEHDFVVEAATKGGRRPGRITLSYAPPPPEGSDIFKTARENAAAADVAVVCVGVPPRFSIGGHHKSKDPATRGWLVQFQGENADRSQYKLPSWQAELIQEVAKANPNTVVLLFTAGGVAMNSWEKDTPAIMEVFHPGSEGGNIVSALLYGDVNPSGKLTISWPYTAKDLPYNGTNGHYHDTVNEFGYRYFDKQGIKVRFPFGYGLSYTTFEYKTLSVKKAQSEMYPYTATVTIKNTGKVAGKEVVQVYSSDLEARVEQPVKELAGFAKVDLKPGEVKTVEIPLHWTAFQFFDVDKNQWVFEPGQFIIRAGGSSATLPLTVSLTADGEK